VRKNRSEEEEEGGGEGGGGRRRSNYDVRGPPPIWFSLFFLIHRCYSRIHYCPMTADTKIGL